MVLVEWTTKQKSQIEKNSLRRRKVLLALVAFLRGDVSPASVFSPSVTVLLIVLF